jgi:hypothetical protein
MFAPQQPILQYSIIIGMLDSNRPAFVSMGIDDEHSGHGQLPGDQLHVK